MGPHCRSNLQRRRVTTQTLECSLLRVQPTVRTRAGKCAGRDTVGSGIAASSRCQLLYVREHQVEPEVPCEKPCCAPRSPVLEFSLVIRSAVGKPRQWLTLLSG